MQPHFCELKDKPIKIVLNNLTNKTEEDWMRKLWDELQEANAHKEE